MPLVANQKPCQSWFMNNSPIKRQQTLSAPNQASQQSQQVKAGTSCSGFHTCIRYISHWPETLTCRWVKVFAQTKIIAEADRAEIVLPSTLPWDDGMGLVSCWILYHTGSQSYENNKESTNGSISIVLMCLLIDCRNKMKRRQMIGIDKSENI